MNCWHVSIQWCVQQFSLLVASLLSLGVYQRRLSSKAVYVYVCEWMRERAIEWVSEWVVSKWLSSGWVSSRWVSESVTEWMTESHTYRTRCATFPPKVAHFKLTSVFQKCIARSETLPGTEQQMRQGIWSPSVWGRARDENTEHPHRTPTHNTHTVTGCSRLLAHALCAWMDPAMASRSSIVLTEFLLKQKMKYLPIKIKISLYLSVISEVRAQVYKDFLWTNIVPYRKI